MAEPAANWSNFIDHAAMSDVGLRRSNNQDSYAVVLASDEQGWLDRGHLFMVADGMGAHAAGELASKLACNGISHTYHKLLDRASPEALRQAIIETNAHIHGRGQANAEFHGMGTTTSVLLLLPQGAVVGHVGDSRVYRLRNRRLEQLTFDHSLVWEMTASGQVPAGAAGANFIPKNIITRSLGPHAEVKVDLEGPFPLEVGDTFMLCSDGLSGQVTDEQIGAILGCLSPTEAARALIDLANLNGGPDNITVLVAKVVKPLAIAAGDRVFHLPTAGRRKGVALHPALWVGIGVALLIAMGLGIAGQYVLAAASLVLAGLSAIGGVLQSVSKNSGEATTSASGPFGRGPHTTLDCTPGPEVLRSLTQLSDKLREAAKDQKWSVDWQRFDSLLQAGATASAAGNYGQAVRQTALAISFMMSEIRQQRPKAAGRDSTLMDL